MQILLSFTGYHDPFAETALEGDESTGPILTALSVRPFDAACLLVTPKLRERSELTREAIHQRHPAIEVALLETPLADPTNHRGILRQLRQHFRRIHQKHPEADFSISISSGSPHMHACWLLLVASGEIPAVIFQTTPPQFVPEGRSRVTEIDLSHREFPQITAPIPEPDESTPADSTLIAEACRELGIVGTDPAFQQALERAFVYAQFDETRVLLLGETGSGKEEFARFIHHCSRRSAREPIVVNCGSIPENLVESHLFGHRKGAFTGATESQPGKFKAAHGSTIFLDELGELPLPAQAKLLRVVEKGEIEVVGSNKTEKVDVRIIAATNRDLRQMVKAGQFREDLFMRFGSTIPLPALRERPTDIPTLAIHFLDRWNATHKQQRRLAVDAIRALAAYRWPGNIRELAHVIRESAMFSKGKVIRREDLELTRHPTQLPVELPSITDGLDLPAYLEEVKQQLISRAMQIGDGNQSQAAKLLLLSPQNLGQYLRRHTLK